MTYVYGSCAKFYYCNKNVLQIMTCPKNYLFDSVTKRCQLAARVECPCWKNCKNGGVCYKDANKTENCMCQNGFYGSFCELSKSTTSSGACRNTTCYNG